jgi:hypothetical protein
MENKKEKGCLLKRLGRLIAAFGKEGPEQNGFKF